MHLKYKKNIFIMMFVKNLLIVVSSLPSLVLRYFLPVSSSVTNSHPMQTPENINTESFSSAVRDLGSTNRLYNPMITGTSPPEKISTEP